jgi:hypothetical protein
VLELPERVHWLVRSIRYLYHHLMPEVLTWPPDRSTSGLTFGTKVHHALEAGHGDGLGDEQSLRSLGTTRAAARIIVAPISLLAAILHGWRKVQARGQTDQ